MHSVNPSRRPLVSQCLTVVKEPTSAVRLRMLSVSLCRRAPSLSLPSFVSSVPLAGVFFPSSLAPPPAKGTNFGASSTSFFAFAVGGGRVTRRQQWSALSAPRRSKISPCVCPPLKRHKTRQFDLSARLEEGLCSHKGCPSTVLLRQFLEYVATPRRGSSSTASEKYARTLARMFRAKHTVGDIR